MVVAALAWSHFAFGAVYPWAALPLLALSAGAVLLARAWPNPLDIVDVSCMAVVAVIALHLAPLPPGLIGALSPDAGAYRSAMLLDYDARGWMPISLDPARTRVTLVIAAAAFALFAAVRRIAWAEGRFIARWIAWIALAGSLLGIGRKTLAPTGRIYGFWMPIEPGAAPFGAIINRNHFADWCLMAVVVILGGLAAHLARRDRARDARRALADILGDARVLWLSFAAAVTVVAIVLTASRSAFAGLLASALVTVLLMWRRANARAVGAVSIAGVLCLAAALSWARPDVLMARIDEGNQLGLRQTIWRETAAIARRYPIAGVGAGAYPSAMAYYQADRGNVFFNHAHNQYLEIVTEGGALLALPLVLFLAALAWRIRRGLRADRGSHLWLRIGAAAALAGLAVACIWESPFRTPATLMLAAVAAGLAAAEDRV